MVICPDCGTANERDAKFCKSCGRTLAGLPAAEPTPNDRTDIPDTSAKSRVDEPGQETVKTMPRPVGDDGLPAGEDLDGHPGGERIIWTGRPCLPLSWFSALMTRYRLTNERLIITHGFISKRSEELELYRVNDVGFRQGLTERIFRLGDVRLETTDASAPEPQLKDIRHPERVKDLVRAAARTERQRRRVLFRDEV